jgi:hypothetical protein
MNTVYTYNPNVFSNMQGTDWERWRSLYKLIGFGVSFADRTDIIKTPVRTTTPDSLRMPEYQPDFSKTYEECCLSRVDELVAIQNRLDVPIKILYSGGIDSSLILTSFIKQLGVAETAKRVIVLLDQESIHENPGLWEKFIRPHFRIIDSDKYGAEFNSTNIIVAGEGNDQLMGSDIYKDIIRWGGTGILDRAWTEGLIKDYFLLKGMTSAESDIWFSRFDQLISHTDCSVVTIADWWWYINFSCKWSSVYHRMMFYVQDSNNITHDYMNTYYQQFFNTADFQLWSMVDRQHKHRGDYISYKYHAKDLILDVVKDVRYNVKIKRPSLFNITKFKYGCDLIDSDYKLQYNIDPLNYYNEHNDFHE